MAVATSPGICVMAFESVFFFFFPPHFLKFIYCVPPFFPFNFFSWLSFCVLLL